MKTKFRVKIFHFRCVYFRCVPKFRIFGYRMAQTYFHINQCNAGVQYLANIHRDRRQCWLLLYEAVFVGGRDEYLYYRLSCRRINKTVIHPWALLIFMKSVPEPHSAAFKYCSQYHVSEQILCHL